LCAAEAILTAFTSLRGTKIRSIAARFERCAWFATERPLATILSRSGAKFRPSAAGRSFETPPFRPVPFLRRDTSFLWQHLRNLDAARFHLAFGRQP
jgi:hypothetical protein